jgi:murein DD-endopeptidase MepM/ murein hydrolase activator NlpD
VRTRLVALLLAGTFGCGEDRAPESAPTPPDLSSSASANEAPARLAGDPFEGIEDLRPEPWTGWPLENVDIATEAGWRVDPISGKFQLEQRLSFTAEPGAWVLAIAPGEVLELHGDPSAGIELVIDHGDGIESRYGPLGDALVHVGLPVTRGAAIGLARGKILRLSVTVDGVAIDPLLVLRQPLHRWPAALREPPKRVEPAVEPTVEPAVEPTVEIVDAVPP